MTENKTSLEKVENALKFNEEVYFQDSNPRKASIAKLEDPVIETLINGIGKKKYDLGDREIHIYVASPLEAIRQGEAFYTCKSLIWEEDKAENQLAIDSMTSLTDQVVYAEDENGNIIGRESLNYIHNDIYPFDVEFTRIRGGDEASYTSLESERLNSELDAAIKDYVERMGKKAGLPIEGDNSKLYAAAQKYEEDGVWFAPEKA